MSAPYDSGLQRLPGPPSTRQARLNALERYHASGLPTRRDEDWKYTDVSAVGRRATLEPAATSPSLPQDMLMHIEQSPPGLVFIDGHYAAELSARFELPAGATLGNLADHLDIGDIEAALFDPGLERTPFDALNSAFANCGIVLCIPPGAALAEPIRLLFIASGSDAAIYPRNLIVAAENARLCVIEHYFGPEQAGNFTDARTDIRLGAGARMQHCKLVQEGARAIHIASIRASLAENSRLDAYSFVLDGMLTRNDISAGMNGAGAYCALNGLYLTDQRQHVDHHTRIDHQAPDCTSREYYRGILDGESRAVFNGKVVVHPGAVMSDAHQANHHLLLSRSAEADTKPQLEIFADDVKCTHGATVGQLDDTSLFYLRSRGIDDELARAMLIYGFANDIIGRIDDAALRDMIATRVLDKLPQGTKIKELL